jgi:octanoyl-[GcvH]:protein N-octanoyltransferase
VGPPVLRLVRQAFPRPPERDTAVSHAILRRVAAGLEPETLRLHRPGPVVAFGPKDRLAPGFPEAVRAARGQGFGAVQRLAGGRAAVFHEDTIAFSWVVPEPAPRMRIRERFDALAGLVAEALRDVGVDARVGEVPGEYCPGEHSVNARGRTKIMGVGQRLIQGAAHVGGVIVVGGADRVRDVLVPVYRALGLDWDPTTAGSVRDEVPSAGWDDVRAAVERRFGDRFELIEGTLSADTLADALALEVRHRVDA